MLFSKTLLKMCQVVLWGKNNQQLYRYIHVLADFFKKLVSRKRQEATSLVVHSSDSVDGRNPAPPGMYKTL